MSKLIYIEDPNDPELIVAWESLRARDLRISRSASTDGWQYHGTSCDEQGWAHQFVNRRLKEEAQSEEEYQKAFHRVPVSKPFAQANGLL